jgi:hypothetical protein
MAKGKPIGVRLDEAVRRSLETLAQADERSLSFILNRIAKEYLRERGLLEPAARATPSPKRGRPAKRKATK